MIKCTDCDLNIWCDGWRRGDVETNCVNWVAKRIVAQWERDAVIKLEYKKLTSLKTCG
jgi:hypothetical protein